MRYFLAAGAALIMSFSAALSADLPPRPVYKSPAVVLPGFSWTGFYLGANVGYGWTSESGTITVTGAGTGPISGRSDGVLGGLQVGYNWQTGPVVFGIETDFQGSAAKGTVTGFPGAASINATGKVPWFGTIRGRLGYDIDRTMVYVTGGALYGNAKLDGTISTTGAFSTSVTYWTYTVGAGIERQFLPNWSAKLEYLYAGTPSEVPLPPNTSDITGSAHAHIVRVGINYHF